MTGTVYGVALNDREQRARLASAFLAEPYGKPPEAPILYIKPAMSLNGGGTVPVPDGVEVEIGPTIALLFARDTVPGANDGWSRVGAACLAIDVSVGEAGFYRPPLAQRSRDGSLPHGRFTSPFLPDAITTRRDGAIVHRWSLARLHRPVAALIDAIAAATTLAAGDMLLIGLPGDAPLAAAGQRVRVEADGYPALDVVMAAAA